MVPRCEKTLSLESEKVMHLVPVSSRSGIVSIDSENFLKGCIYAPRIADHLHT